MSKISVLTAVYNDEAHIRKCLDSLCSQTLSDIQIICIDDHSTDSTLSILHEYAEKDPRVLVLEQEENRGQAVARNEGIKLADGEFITMLDSDDWFAPDSLEKAYNALNESDECDCALFKLMLCYPEEEGDGIRMEEFENHTTHKLMTGKDAFVLSLDQSIHGLYLARAELFRQYPYDTSCRLYSDDNTTCVHYLHSRHVVFSEGEYFYLKHKDASTSKPTILRFEYMFANLNLKRTLEREAEAGMLGSDSESQKILDFYESHRWLIVVDCYYFYYLYRKQFTAEERQEIKSQFAEILNTIETRRISWNLRIKPGYTPVKRWWLFNAMENVYFFVKHKVSPSDHF